MSCIKNLKKNYSAFAISLLIVDSDYINKLNVGGRNIELISSPKTTKCIHHVLY